MASLRKKRLFIALNLPTITKKTINNFTDSIRVKTPDIRWISSEGLHITLHFLGELNFEKEKEIEKSLQSLDNQFKEIELETGKIGAFPNKDNPRVVYLECKQVNGNSIEKLQKLIGESLIRTGIRIDRRRWHPHITIGRIRRPTKIDLNFEIEKIKFKLKSFEIIEAHLKPTGAEYTETAKYNLAKKNE